MLEQSTSRIKIKYLKKFTNLAAFPTTGDIYSLFLDESTKYLYEWDGSIYNAILDANNLKVKAIWAYQDFSAGVISSTSATLTANENGTSAPFITGDIINSSATIFRQDALSYSYSGVTKWLSTKVKVDSHSSASITLNAVPNSTWGTIRIWYQIKATSIPDDYRLPPMTVQSNVVSELGNVFEEEENKDSSGGYAGLTALKLNLRNVANTFTSFITNTNTASRTYTFQDSDGTVAFLSDISTVETIEELTDTAITSPTDNSVLQYDTGTAKWIDTDLSTLKTDLTLVKGDVGLGNVDNTSDSTKNSASATLTNKTINSDNNTITNIVNADIKAGASIDASKIADGTVSDTEYQYLNGVTSAIQTQINAIETPPVGGVIWYAKSTTPPAGWLVCDGSSLSIITYADLFAVLGYTFGGSGVNFNIPNITGANRFIRGNTTVGITESDAFKAHTHTTPIGNADGTGSAWGYNAKGSGTDQNAYTSGASSDGGGGSETRPINITLLPIIKY